MPTGPATVAEGLLVNGRRGSPLVQIAPETPHSRPAGSVIVTAAPESGLTVILNRSRRPSTRLPPVTRPPVTVNASSRSARKLIPMSSLKATRKWNPPSPRCAAGTSSNVAVSPAGASSGGPATVAEGLLVSWRRFSPFVQIAPETPHSRPAGSSIVTSPAPSGSTVISNRSRRSSTRAPRVTRPPVTASASSRSARKLIPMSSLNAIRNVNALPSCAAGTSSNVAVSGWISLLWIVPVASPSPDLSFAPSGFDSVSVNVSPSSSWASSVIGTDTVRSVSSELNLSVPRVSV